MNTSIRRNGSVWLVVCAMGACALALSAQGASFDCAKAATKVEKLICSDAELSKLDEDLAHSYKAALQDQSKAELTRQAQKEWVKKRNTCVDVGCVKQAYRQRIRQLSSAKSDATQAQTAVASPQATQVTSTQLAKKYPPYPDTWQWQFSSPSNVAPLNLFMLSNGDVLAGNKLLFGGQSVVSGELLPANARGDLVKANGKNILSLDDGSQVAGISGGSIFGSIKLSDGSEITGSSNAYGECYHGPVSYFYEVRDKKEKKLGASKVIFLLLNKPKHIKWERPNSLLGGNVEVDPCSEEGPPGYYTRVEAAWGGDIFPLDDGTFLLPMNDGLIVRFDEHFNTKAPLLNHRFFVFDINDSKLFIDKLNGKKYNLRKTGYQPVYDDLYKYLSNVRSKQP